MSTEQPSYSIWKLYNYAKYNTEIITENIYLKLFEELYEHRNISKQCCGSRSIFDRIRHLKRSGNYCSTYSKYIMLFK